MVAVRKPVLNQRYLRPSPNPDRGGQVFGSRVSGCPADEIKRFACVYSLGVYTPPDLADSPMALSLNARIVLLRAGAEHFGFISD
jgi:hypothetical protein